MANTSTSVKQVQDKAEELLGQAQDAIRQPAHDVLKSLRDYAHQNPESAALWCLGIGFVLGWRLKPW